MDQIAVIDEPKTLEIPEDFNFPAIIEAHGFDLTGRSNREIIDIIEWIIINKVGNIIDDLPVKHTLSGGVYARQITIPAGIILTGKIHNFDHVNIMSKGDMTIMTDEGIKRLQAPYEGATKAGIRRIGFAHEETVWTTIHATNETDIETIENILFETPCIDWVEHAQGGINGGRNISRDSGGSCGECSGGGG